MADFSGLTFTPNFTQAADIEGGWGEGGPPQTFNNLTVSSGSTPLFRYEPNLYSGGSLVDLTNANALSPDAYGQLLQAIQQRLPAGVNYTSPTNYIGANAWSELPGNKPEGGFWGLATQLVNPQTLMALASLAIPGFGPVSALGDLLGLSSGVDAASSLADLGSAGSYSIPATHAGGSLSEILQGATPALGYSTPATTFSGSLGDLLSGGTPSYFPVNLGGGLPTEVGGVSGDTPSWVNDLLRQTGELALSPSSIESGFLPTGASLLPSVGASLGTEALSGLGASSAFGAVSPSSVGGYADMLEKLKKMLGLNMSTPMAALSAISGLMGLKSAGDLRKMASTPTTQTTTSTLYDPFAGSRGIFQGQLNSLAMDPSQIFANPSYKAGEQAVMRQMAANGYLGSGNLNTALMDYGSKFYNDQISRLATLAGGNISPTITGQTTTSNANQIQANIASNDQLSRALATLGYTARGIWG